MIWLQSTNATLFGTLYLNDAQPLQNVFSFGNTNFSFIFCLKIIFFIFFIFLNIYLIYIEYLDRKYKNIHIPDSHLKSALGPELQRIVNKAIVGIGLLSSYIAIKNEYIHQQTLAIQKANSDEILNQVNNDLSKLNSQLIQTNINNKMNITRIKNSFAEVEGILDNESKIQKLIKEKNVQ